MKTFKKAQLLEVSVAEPAISKTADAVTLPAVVKGDYRSAALEHYGRKMGDDLVNVCVVCGFGIQAVLEVAHLDHDRKNGDVANLATLCPNCHKMHDIGLIPTKVVVELRDANPAAKWSIRMKDAGKKAAETRRLKTAKAKKSVAAKKAWSTRVAAKAKVA